MTDPRHKASRNQENGVAKRFGSKQHRGSGSGRRGNDSHTDDSLIECKTVLEGNTQITIKADDLKSLAFRAAIEDRDPVLHIHLEAAAPRKNWVCIPEEDHLESHDT